MSSTQAPQITVLVPVYNVERYLRECLDSIRAQTFVDFEAICINDGSTDASRDIIQEYLDGRCSASASSTSPTRATAPP